MLGFGNGASLPLASLLYCMNTRFHTSINLSQSHSTLHSGLPHPIPSPWSMCISEQGPHGPVSLILQKLSFSPSLTILLAGIPIFLFQILNASSSSLYTVIHSFSLGSFSTSVMKQPSYNPSSPFREIHP